MSEARINEATKAQIAAALPKRSAWVSANAGSGKTRVLTNRVARLLLQGTAPGKILCLTFTKAAAAEMQIRLFKQLGQWAMMPDAALRDALAALGEVDLPDAQLMRARSLFARALETPGGLKIQTIHAFCESLLHRFPLEAQVSPDFELLDERQAAELRREVLDAMAGDAPDLFAEFIGLNGDPAGYIADFQKFQQLFDAGFYPVEAAKVIEAEPGLSEEMLLARVMEGVSDSEIDALVAAMMRNDKGHDPKAAKVLAEYKTAPVSAALDWLEAVFLTSGNRRKTTSFPNKKTKDAFAGAFDLVSMFIERIFASRQSRLALVAFEKARVLNTFAADFLGRYSAKKAAQSALEFEDLIRKADALLRQSDMAQWVLYRLDGGIDHILVDEAQDTSPLQWDIVKALAEEIYAAQSETDSPRTIFVVGDEKQSIFSFQGADPHEFARVKALLHTRLNAVESPMFEGGLQCSFRSAPPILALVDKIFEGDARGGIAGDISHTAVDDNAPGRVEIWPFYEKETTPEQLPWDAPVDTLPASDPVLQLARDVAARVAEIIASGQVLPGKSRPVQAGDFLILVQSRSTLFRALLKELKAKNVPVAGADRLKVVEELAVKDLLALLQFAANPGDDLSLACALRSPLCGRSEAGLFSLAHGRKGSLWQAVQPDDMLSDILANTDYERPFELLQRILIHHKGREKLLARLGPEAEEGVDELLRQALEYERSAAPSLTGFLDWISADALSVKRQFNKEDNLLRIMTVHGAKGLESPIVILPQTVKKHDAKGSAVLPLPEGLATSGNGISTLPEKLLAVHQQQIELQKEERMRLLYVAFTRAESWLIIAGSGARTKGADNWYDPAFDAALALGGETGPDGRMLLENNWELVTAASNVTVSSKIEPPRWLAENAEKAIKPPRPRAPSALGGAHTILGATPDENALLRGEQIHTLLENLAKLASDAREKAANLLFDAPLQGVVEEALTTLSHPDLAAIFAPDTLFEVPISATLPGIGPIQGRIDALLVGEEILAVDFKSNPQVPESANETPEAFLRQMAAYGAALHEIWPEKTIKTAILWTATRQLMEIPSHLLDAALKRAASA